MNKTKLNQKVVRNIRDFVPMRFRLTNPKALVTKKPSKLLNLLTQKIRTPQKSQKIQIEESVSLKFLQKISNNHMLIGNQYQLNLLDLSGIFNDYVATSAEWNISQEEIITRLFVMQTANLFFVVCSNIIYPYRFRVDAIEEVPTMLQRLSFQGQVMSVCLVRKTVIIIFLKNSIVTYLISIFAKTIRLIKKQTFPYNQHEHFDLISVPLNQGNDYSIFFRKKEINKVSPLYKMLIQCKSEVELVLHKIQVFCQIPERYFNNQMQIFYHGSNIFILHIGQQLYAVKNGYFLDSISSDTSKVKSFLKYFSNSNFFLFHQGRFDYFHYTLDQKQIPEKFKVECLDSIPVKNPKDSIFFDVKELGDRLVFVFQSIKSTKSEICFWLGISDLIDRYSKINVIYPQSEAQVSSIDKKGMDEKVEIAQQIGYTNSEAYLQLWSRSSKSTDKDYQILISTQDYDVISQEISNKFKKNSLHLTKIQKVMKKCLQMLYRKVMSPDCSVQTLKQYSSCHFLFCKYQMFKKLKLHQNTLLSLSQIMVSIQDYYQLIQIQLKKTLIEYLGEFCLQNKDVVLKIRALMTEFALIYHLQYKQILPKIIKAFLKQFLQLIKAIPQILPIISTENEIKNLKGGIWPQVNFKNTPNYVILQNLTTFENKKTIQQFIKSKFFKIYQWHTHGALVGSISDINKNIQAVNPKVLFIELFQILYTQRQKIGPQRLKDIINHVQKNYPLLPTYLKGRFRFYQALYDNFRQYLDSQKKPFLSVFEFFSLSEDELFLIYFRKERAKKGIFILKQIKPIYERTVDGGEQLFLQNMFNFFKQNQSSWADLKIILNKFNNEKDDFHRQNYKIFEIIVKSIMQKVYIGTNNINEAGLGEVLSYIQNIPFPLQQSDLFQNIVSIQQIHSQQATLKSIGVNMNIRQILQRGQEVIYKMMKYQIERNRVRELDNSQELKLYAYKILAQINYRKSNIYLDKHCSFVLKSFVIILMQEQRFVTLCKEILIDQYLRNEFKVQQGLIQNIVIYLYRKRLHQNPIYYQSMTYIQKLSDLLNSQSVKRRFLELSEQYANIFSLQGHKMKYPFFETYYPRIEEVTEAVNSLAKEEVDKVDYQHVFEIVIELKSLGQQVQNIIETNRNMFMNQVSEEKFNIMKRELYSLFFVKFIEEGLIQKAMNIAQQIMQVSTRFDLYNIIFPVFLLEVLVKELLLRTQEPLIKLISYYFNSQRQLLQIIHEFLNPKNIFSNKSLDVFIEEKRQARQNQPIFNPNNQLFSTSFKKIIINMDTETQARTFNPILESIWSGIQTRKQQYTKNKIYSVIFRLLLHHPYILPEYILRKRTGINILSFRAMLTFMGMERLFNMQKILQLGEQIFSILLTKIETKLFLEDVLERYTKGERYTKDLPYTDEILRNQIKFKEEHLLGNSILSFRNKLTAYRSRGRTMNQQLKLDQLQNSLFQDDITTIHLNSPYPFSDGDEAYMRPEYDLNISITVKKETIFEFDEVTEMSQLCQHINYFLKPAYKHSKVETSLFQFDKVISKKITKKHIHRAQTIATQINPLISKQILSYFLKPYENSEVVVQIKQPSSSPDSPVLQRASRSLRNIKQDDKREDEEDQMESKRISMSSSNSLTQHINNYLYGNESFQKSLLPSLPTITQKTDFLQTIIPQIWNKYSTPLPRRVSLIWQLKRILLEQSQISSFVYNISMRLSQCELISSLLTPIQQIFTDVIFLEQFSEQNLIQLIKQNISESPSHQEDMIKLGNIIGEVFASQKAKNQIIMLFLVKQCRKYANTHEEREKNHLKDQIIYLKQNISVELIEKVISQYSCSKNQDLIRTAKALQYFKGYQRNQVSHIKFTSV